MTSNAQRLAIARMCPDVAVIDGTGVPVWKKNTREYFDPLEDLNAIHEAEKVLREDEGPYGSLLCRDILERMTRGCAWNADAATGTKAVILACNLWTTPNDPDA